MIHFLRKVCSNNYILIFLIIYISADSILFGTNSNSFFINISHLFILGFGVYSLFKIVFNRNRYNTYYIYIMFIVFSFLCTAIVNFSFSGGFVYQFFVFIICIYVVEKMRYNDFSAIFENIVFYLTICSLLVHLFVLVNLELPFSFMVENMSGNMYKHYGVYTLPVSQFSIIVRNSSIFREPGVFMIYLLFALLIAIYNNAKFKHYIVYYLALLSTFSTAGIILGMFVIILQLYFWKNRMKFLTMILIGLFGFLLLNSESIYSDKMFGKLDVSSDSYKSTEARLTSITIPFEIFCSNIVTGVGFDNFATLYRTVSAKQTGEIFEASGVSTNYIMNMFAKFGLLIGLFIVFCLYNLSKRMFQDKYNLFSHLLIFFIICAAFSNEDICNSLIFNIFLFYGLKSTYTKWRKIRC